MVIKIKGVLLAGFWILFWFSAEASGFLSIVVFCDGTPHDRPEIQEDDREKREVLEDAGFVVLAWHYATPLADFINQYSDIFTPVK
jgi:hypothetical protein